MRPRDAIESAIETGQSQGLNSMSGWARDVFAISELEVACDIDGIDSYVDRYGAAGLSWAAKAYAAIGATDLATALADAAGGSRGDDLLDRINSLVTARVGYEAADIERHVQAST